MQGRIIKGIGGFYYVETAEGLYECKARGLFRKEKMTPLVGDLCEISTMPDFKGYVEKILPRTNSFIRPPVANVDNMFIVFAAQQPDPITSLIDKLTVAALRGNAKPCIVINKMDLENENTAEIMESYRKTGFKVYPVCAATGEGTAQLMEDMKDKISVFTGCSGVGKSSILNRLLPSYSLETGEVSSKIRRGKHTTREVTLLKLPFGGYIADTPGFSELILSEIVDIDKEDLYLYFPEIEKCATGCNFRDCSHVNEPGCRVKEAVEAGEIGLLRYESYKEIYKQLGEIKKWEKK